MPDARHVATVAVRTAELGAMVGLATTALVAASAVIEVRRARRRACRALRSLTR